MQSIVPALTGLIACSVFQLVILYLLMPMLKEVGAIRKNYLGIDIPVSVGISFPMTIMTVFGIFGLFAWYESSYHLFVLGVMSMSF